MNALTKAAIAMGFVYHWETGDYLPPKRSSSFRHHDLSFILQALTEAGFTHKHVNDVYAGSRRITVAHRISFDGKEVGSVYQATRLIHITPYGQTAEDIQAGSNPDTNIGM